MSYLKHEYQAGDTIVEVMICLAIVAFSLAASYTLSRLSLNQVRDAQERSQSMLLAQQQLERTEAFLAKYPTLHTHPVNETSINEGDYILDPVADSANNNYGIDFSRQFNSTVSFPGFCIYKDLKTIYFTFDSQDPNCAVNQNGDFYCEQNNDTKCHTVPCNPSNDPPCSTTLTDNATNQAMVNAAGYPFRAGSGTLPLALSGVCSTEKYCSEDDGFAALAGRYEVGGIGQNSDKYSVVSIPFRIHQ